MEQHVLPDLSALASGLVAKNSTLRLSALVYGTIYFQISDNNISSKNTEIGTCEVNQ